MGTTKIEIIFDLANLADTDSFYLPEVSNTVSMPFYNKIDATTIAGKRTLENHQPV